MSRIDITSEDYDRLMSFKGNTGKYTDKDSVTINPDTMTSTDKIYVFPTCKIRKLPMRKYIKSLGVKQVFKPEQATALVLPEYLISDSNWSNKPINILSGYNIKAGTYNYNYDGEKYVTYEDDMLISLDQLKYFIFNTMIQNRSDQHYYNHINEIMTKVSLFEIGYNFSAGSKNMNENHLRALLKSDIKLINESNMQQTVYDWEVNENVRVSTEDYSWDAIQDLLESNDYEVAITIIKKLNVEPILSKLIAMYLSRTTNTSCKRALYEKIFIRKPVLHENITNWRRIYYTNVTDILREVSKLKNVGMDLNYKDFEVAKMYIKELKSANGDITFNVDYNP